MSRCLWVLWIEDLLEGDASVPACWQHAQRTIRRGYRGRSPSGSQQETCKRRRIFLNDSLIHYKVVGLPILKLAPMIKWQMWIWNILWSYLFIITCKISDTSVFSTFFIFLENWKHRINSAFFSNYTFGFPDELFWHHVASGPPHPYRIQNGSAAPGLAG